jgi:CMP-N-acetylneuraminic acid synthetase
VKAFELFQEAESMDSLRAMEITNTHPGKMWRLGDDNRATPFLSQIDQKIPTHDRPTQSLEKLWIQNASLEFIRFRSLVESKTISGKKVFGYIMPGLEGLDVNTQFDWDYLENLVNTNTSLLKQII